MRRMLALILFAFLLPISVSAQKSGDLSLSLSLTRGERSRDSHSQTTRITLKGRELVYEKSYGGYRGARTAPVRKSFRVKEEELEQLKKLVRENSLLTSDSLEAAGAESSGVRRYFEIALDINLDGKKASVEISGPRSATEIREKKIYRNASVLLDAVYKILVEQDKEIGYENRDLIQ